MFKKGFVILLAFFLLFIFTAVNLSAQTQQDERIVVKRSDLPPDLLKEIELKSKVEKYGKWAGMGKEVGTAINEGLKAITTNTAEFADTNLGRFTMFLIAYKVIGTDFIQFIIGVPLLIVGTIIFIWSYWKNCVTRRILIDKKEKRYETHKGDSDEKWAHTLMYFAFIIFCTLVIFV